MKKVLFVQHTDIMGGSLKGGLDMIRILRDASELTVFVPNAKEVRLAFPEVSKVHFVSEELGTPPTFDYFNGCNSVFRLLLKYILLLVKNGSRWKSYFATHQQDCVVLNTSVLWPLRKVIQNTGAECYCYVRETLKGSKNSLLNKMIRKELSKCDKAFFLSEYDKDSWDLSCACQCIIPEIVCDPNIEDIPMDGVEAASGFRFLILYMGGIQKLKGADLLIEALYQLRERGIQDIGVICLGNTGLEPFSLKKKSLYREQYRYCAYCNNMIKHYKLSEAFRRIGYRKDVYRWLNKCDLVAFPVREVHQARPVYEAGICKKTIIVPNYENYRESVIDGYNGLCFVPGDARNLADRILELYVDRKKLNNLGENNYKMACKNHLFESIKGRAQEIILR